MAVSVVCMYVYMWLQVLRKTKESLVPTIPLICAVKSRAVTFPGRVATFTSNKSTTVFWLCMRCLSLSLSCKLIRSHMCVKCMQCTGISILCPIGIANSLGLCIYLLSMVISRSGHKSVLVSKRGGEKYVFVWSCELLLGSLNLTRMHPSEQEHALRNGFAREHYALATELPLSAPSMCICEMCV